MPEHLRSLVVIVVIAAFVFAIVKPHVCPSVISEEDFSRRRNIWLMVTLISFLAHNFWIYIIAVGAVLLTIGKGEPKKVGLYLFLLFAVPPISTEIGGLGVIRYFIAIDYLRLLSLAILLPAALVIRKASANKEMMRCNADRFLGAYLVLVLLLQLNVDTFTNTLRHGFYFFIDIVLPYYVVSRSLKTVQDFRDALTSFAIASAVLAVIGIFEFGRHWLLYAPLKEALGVPWGYGNYLERNDILRALASTGQPIVLGYVMAVAIGLFLFLQKAMPNRTVQMAGLALLVAGLIAPVSRGPWIGGAVVLLVFVATGPKALSRITQLAAAGVATLPILLSTSVGDKIISYLPFVGSIEEDTITFRQRLIDLSIQIILENPLFGSYDFMLQLEELRAQGIIDLVNSYLNIALSSGLVGLFLFMAFFCVILIGIRKGMHKFAKDHELYLLGRVLIATTIGILVTIFTVSSINVIPVIYWSVAGFGFAYIQLVAKTPPVLARVAT